MRRKFLPISSIHVFSKNSFQRMLECAPIDSYFNIKIKKNSYYQIMKKLGNGGFLGPTRDPEYGGLGLDYSYSVAIAEELGSIRCGGVPMAIGIQSGILINFDIIVL